MIYTSRGRDYSTHNRKDMITRDMKLSTVAQLSGTPYTKLKGWANPRQSAYVRKDGTHSVKTLPPKIQSFRKDGHVWLAAETVNALIEKGVISDFTL